MNNSTTTIKIAGLFGFIAVAVGAMGAHAIKPYLTDYQRQTYETAVQFHFYHTLALLMTGIWRWNRPQLPSLKWATWAFSLGILCFSGSLYLLASRELLQFSVLWMGPITPIGGVFFMTGWLLLVYAAFQQQKQPLT
jgi:uncharacterized membrane protein YgdD (TMEM256/DUF423 family)